MLFGVNYLLIYLATSELTSGLIAVIFSTIVLMNIANSAVFQGKVPSQAMLAGALLGLVGISLVFWPELINLQNNSAALAGLGLSLLGTFIASLGNIISAHNQRQKLPVIQTNAFGMAYGALLLIVVGLVRELPFAYELSLEYNLSLVYLALFGSVLAFGSYLTLLGRIGPEKAAYAMVLFPLVALGISTLFEGYQWTWSAVVGITLVIVGNVLVVIENHNIFQRLPGHPRYRTYRRER